MKDGQGSEIAAALIRRASKLEPAQWWQFVLSNARHLVWCRARRPEGGEYCMGVVMVRPGHFIRVDVSPTFFAAIVQEGLKVKSTYMAPDGAEALEHRQVWRVARQRAAYDEIKTRLAVFTVLGGDPVEVVALADALIDRRNGNAKPSGGGVKD